MKEGGNKVGNHFCNVKMKLPDGDSENEPFIPREVDCKSDRRISTMAQRLRPLLPRFSANISGYLFLAMLNIALWAVMLTWFNASSNICLDEAEHYYSPVLNYTKISIETQSIQAKLFPDDGPLAFSAAPPSKEVDDAWYHLSRNMIFGLTQSDVIRLGKDPTSAVKFNPEWNISSSEDLYLGVLDVFHQIHCLNMLRQNLIINYDYYWGKAYGFRPEVFRERHLSHCTSILLQNIMCHADTEVVTHVWQEGNPVPWPDFGVKKQCRDFNALVEFRDVMDVEDSWDKFRLYSNRPSDAIVFPEEDGFSELKASADEFRNGEYYKDLHIKGCNA